MTTVLVRVRATLEWKCKPHALVGHPLTTSFLTHRVQYSHPLYQPVPHFNFAFADMRLSTAGMWGQGMYFAERAEYSDRYAHRPGMQQAVGHGGCFSFGASFGGVSFGPSAPPLPVSVGGGGGGGGGFNFSQPPSNFVQSHDETNGVKELILAEVLVGESCETQPDRSLRRPPVKTGTHLRYDSVNGLTGGSRVYVTYENGTARPVYLVSYRTG